MHGIVDIIFNWTHIDRKILFAGKYPTNKKTIT